jgi:hypothetical protein
LRCRIRVNGIKNKHAHTSKQQQQVGNERKRRKKKNERTEFLRISTEKESLLDVPD